MPLSRRPFPQGGVMPSSRAFVVGVLLMCVPGDSALHGRQSAQPVLHSRVDLVSLSVSVTDRANHYVADLEQQDFTVFEEGAPQSVTYFRKSEAPLVLTLLLDSSSSMQLKLPTAQRAAIGFVEQLTPADAASVLQFGTRVTTLQELTRDRAALVNAIRRAVADGADRPVHGRVRGAAAAGRRHCRRSGGRPPAQGSGRALGREGQRERARATTMSSTPPRARIP